MRLELFIEMEIRIVNGQVSLQMNCLETWDIQMFIPLTISGLICSGWGYKCCKIVQQQWKTGSSTFQVSSFLQFYSQKSFIKNDETPN